MIFTFYSFKGGVGRSMAVANIAELFYARGLNVLMVDFDLEAPGLERYFNVTNSATPFAEIAGRRGVIDAILSFQELQRFAPKLPPPTAGDTAETTAFPFSVEPLSNFIAPIYADRTRPGKLSIIPSGNRKNPDFAAYAKRVLDFDWARFYTERNGERFFEWFRLELIKDWDVVLIDSRTGVTELGGVCTHHLPDAVISFVATNMQNLDGTAMMARSLANPELVEKGRKGRPLEQLFIPSRVELSEEDKHDNFAASFNRELGLFFPRNQSPEGSWFLDLRLLYVPAYSYLERVAVREPERASKADLIAAYGRLATRMAAMGRSGPLHDAWATTSHRLSNLPARNPYFGGREEELKRIRAVLSAGTPVAICGLAGIGKTALAIEYAQQYRNEYGCMLFCRAGSEDELRHSCEEVVRLLSLDANIRPRDAVRAWLEQNDRWLLILDEANDSTLAHGIVPPNMRGHVLYTTRTQQISELGAQPIALTSLSREAALGFFQNRLGRSELTASERSAAGQLVDELGALPLALEQAAAYIVNRKARVDDYVASFRKRRFGLLDQQPAVSAGRQVSVSAVLEPTLDAIEATPASADVLRAASFLATDPIPVKLLVSGAQQLGEAIAAALAGASDDPLALDDVLEPLTRFSLIHRDQESHTLSVHQLVSDLVRSRVQDPEMWHWRVVAALDATFPSPTWENLDECAALIPHVQGVFNPGDEPPLYIRAGRCLILRGDYLGAEKLLGAILPSERSLVRFNVLWLLAEAYFRQRRLKDSITSLQDLSRLCAELKLGDEFQSDVQLALARSYLAAGSTEMGIKLYEKVLQEFMERGDLPNTVAALCGFAEIVSQSDPERSVRLADQAVGFAEDLDAEEEAMAFGALADSLMAAGRAAEPRTMDAIQKSLEAGERVYGPEHPLMAATLRSYALLLHANGKQSEGAGVYQRAQAIIDQALGPKSRASEDFRAEYERLLGQLRERAGAKGGRTIEA
jgi:cellulose biosynthesis protein BcsQ/tetratricopeptide (TPR) repeat protein